MISLDIPGFGKLEIEHLVMDYNGTLALDGNLLPGVGKLIHELSEDIQLHVLTADTLGQCEEELAHLPVSIHIIEGKAEDQAKLDYVSTLGINKCACIGNGRNDMLMLKQSALGIIVSGRECMSMQAARVADIAATDIASALALFTHPVRLLTTLRN
ncbi:HAD family hydrolase [Maridesulfovibrio hydrothermalis]|uniref:AhpF n=1 Tax=Maridesulfovibrio hydrothermalis AM13 = DSM 14728 TaxID=1121451 RepID=L0R939_9BACT|nr:HAD family hydrolase [Maridesulfovibrio hydrothermalis]CCO23269.1 AhpF [Maridesulfovibrio hydrothermalis AM13 = DSM 14728]